MLFSFEEKMSVDPFPYLENEDRAGICSMEVHFPQTFVSQEELEKYDNVKPGKYTLGLGQSRMAFTTEREDVCSLALTAVSRLMERDGIEYNQIGRLTVATESQIDHAKSIKTVLMQLFEDSGNSDVEGVDYVSACYSGTAGIFDAISWCENKDWDKRYALVVCVDIAVYQRGPALPTGGAGAFCALIGKQPAFYLEPIRAAYMANEYDFYKPNLSSPFPVVDGKHSNNCFAKAFDNCYRLLNKKIGPRGIHPEDYSYFLCHAPYHKLVRKTFSRIYWNDFLLNGENKYPELVGYKQSQGPNHDRPLYTTLTKITHEEFKNKGEAACTLSKEIGNVYSASLWLSLASLCALGEKLAGKRILSFSYGSGLCSSLFVLRGGSNQSSVEKLRIFGKQCDYGSRLKIRIELTPEMFYDVHESNKRAFNSQNEVTPKSTITEDSNAYYLQSKDSQGKRKYEKGGWLKEKEKHDEGILVSSRERYTKAIAGLADHSALICHLV